MTEPTARPWRPSFQYRRGCALQAAATKRMKGVCLGHLPENNNTPKLALRTHRAILGHRWPLHVATRRVPTDVLEV